MVELLDKSCLRDLLNTFYKEDIEFIEKWNIGEGDSVEEMVDHGCDTLDDLLIYCIKEGDEIVAYFGKELYEGDFYLTGFFIKMSHRKPSFFIEFFKSIKDVFEGKDIYCNIHNDNVRAKNFILKNGTFLRSNQIVSTFKLN